MLAVKELIWQIIEQRHVGKINMQRQITKHTKHNTDKIAHKYKNHQVKIFSQILYGVPQGSVLGPLLIFMLQLLTAYPSLFLIVLIYLLLQPIPIKTLTVFIDDCIVVPHRHPPCCHFQHSVFPMYWMCLVWIQKNYKMLTSYRLARI